MQQTLFSHLWAFSKTSSHISQMKDWLNFQLKCPFESNVFHQLLSFRIHCSVNVCIKSIRWQISIEIQEYIRSQMSSVEILTKESPLNLLTWWNGISIGLFLNKSFHLMETTQMTHGKQTIPNQITLFVLSRIGCARKRFTRECWEIVSKSEQMNESRFKLFGFIC